MLAADGALQFTDEERKNPAKARVVIERLAAVRWFSHSVNPIRNLVIPDSLPEPLRNRLKSFKRKCIGWAFPERAALPSMKSVAWALEEAKEILRLIDKSHGTHTTKEDSANNQ